MRLYIAEKREVAAAISEALGGPSRPSGMSYQLAGGDQVTWLSGHLLRLTDPEEHEERFGKWSLDDLPMTWPITHAPEGKRTEHLEQVIELAQRATELVNAGDPDPEGQRLVDEVIEYAGLDSKPVKRVLINDNNPAPIRAAIARIEDNANYRGLSLSALARAVCDQRYGYNLTRCYTLLGRAKGYDGVLSVGRVQTPILGLVVARDRAHEGHSKQAYYTIQARIDLEANPVSGAAAITLQAIYQPTEHDPLDDKGRIIDAVFADGIVVAVRGHSASVLSVDTKDRERSAPLPYNLLALQADAAGLWGYKPKDVLAVTQRLRDRHRAITYNRSDCRYLKDERHAEAPELLKVLAGVYGEAATAADPQRKSKAFNSKKVGAHHGIIPTATVPDPETLNEDERRIYDLIARSYLAQFYPPEQWRSTVVLLQTAGHTFKSTGRVDVAPGWRVLYRDQAEVGDTEDPETEETARADLEQLTTADKGMVTEATATQKFTKPPSRYSMKALLKDLARVARYVTDPKIKELLLVKDADKDDEAGGIGTPATRDSHIDTLFRRGFLAEKSKHIISTDLGRNFHDALPTFATRPDLTALWHEQQRRIEAGELDYQVLLKEVDQAVGAEIARVRSHGLELQIQVDATQCPGCKEGHLRRRKGSKGTFWGCSRYPDCKATFSDKNDKPDLSRKPVVPSTEHLCPECSKGLIRRPAAKKKGVFWWGCSGYPKCTYRTFDDNGKPEIKDEGRGTGETK